MVSSVPRPGAGEVVLRAEGAARRFGATTAFTGVDLEVRAGERVHLRGANGSGKTTLLRCVLGTVRLSTGTLQVAGAPPGHRRALVGSCLNPEQSLYPRLSGHDNLMFAARLRLPSRAARAAVAEIEAEFELGEIAPVRVERCSAGMRARVSIARALLARPALVLLDEPTRSLDEYSRALVWQALDRRPDLTAVIASHRSEDGEHCGATVDLPGHA